MNDSREAAFIAQTLSKQGLFSAPLSLATLDDMILEPSTRKQLSRVVLEHSRRQVLRARGLRPARKILFSGLPGTGKSMGAGAVARALRLPMFRVEVHSVISHYFGLSAQRLAKAFEQIRAVPAVYLFDEFDSIGAERGDVGSSSDGGEARRMVNTLLQLIEDDQSESLIVAATNHAAMLDSALFRRFDEAVLFGALSQETMTALMQRKLSGFSTETLDYTAIYEAVPSLGHADLCAVVDRACKDHVLEDTPISTASLVEGILQRLSVREVYVR